MAFIALYYPPSDARTHFRTGTTVQVTGPVFHTYAEAAAQLGDEEADARRYRSHVLPYVLEVSPGRGGYQIVDVFEAEGRESNPRSKKAKMTPIGHLVAGDDGEQIQMPLLLGIEGGEEYLYEPDDAADLYGQFMGQHAPSGASARKIAHAFHTATTPPAKKRETEAKNAAREKAIHKVAASVDRDVQAHGYAGAIEKSEERLEAVKDALAAGQITPTEAAGPIALETKKQEILLILERFCPQIGPEGTEAIYSVVTATLGGDARAAEAGRVILEGVASKLVGHSVEVDNGYERPAGGVAISIESASGSGRRAASRQAAPEAAEPAKAKSLGPVTASAAASAFLKSNAGKLSGFEPKLVKSIVANALGLSPFPVDAPLADLRAASERVYGLLRAAGLAQASTLAAPFPPVMAPPAPVVPVMAPPAPVVPVMAPPAPVVPVMAPPAPAPASGDLVAEIDALTRQINELNGEIEDLSQNGGVSITLMGQGGALKTAAKEALRLARSPEGPDRVASLRKRVADFAAGIDKAKADKQAEKERAMQRAREIAARSAAPAPSVPRPLPPRSDQSTRHAMQDLGRRVLPGIRPDSAESAGQVWTMLQEGQISQADWQKWVADKVRSNEVRPDLAPAAPAVDPEKAAQDRLLAQIQEANDKAMAALLAKLGD